MPSGVSDIPRMMFIKPGYVLDTEEPPEQGPVELSREWKSIEKEFRQIAASLRDTRLTLCTPCPAGEKTSGCR